MHDPDYGDDLTDTYVPIRTDATHLIIDSGIHLRY
jgi:hypothetical protein